MTFKGTFPPKPFHDSIKAYSWERKPEHTSRFSSVSLKAFCFTPPILQVRLRTRTQSSAELREESQSSSASLLNTHLEHQGCLTETECEHSDAHAKIQQHRETRSLLGEQLQVADERMEQLSIY